MKNKVLISFVVVFFLYATFTVAQIICIVKVDATNFSNDKGYAVFELYNKADGFVVNPKVALKKVVTDIKGGKAHADFTGLKFGDYAVSVYHDENSNNKLDTKFGTMPLEGIALSNNASARKGAPKFDDAKFYVNLPVVPIKLKLSY